MKTDSFSNVARRSDTALIRAARRSVEDMKIERAAMIKRRAPLAAIEALERRIQEAERILKGETPCMKSSDT